MEISVESIAGSPINRTGHFGVEYRGVNYIKCPFDYVTYQMIINEVKPDLIIEIGTSSGGGALYMADILNNLNNGVVHTIDIVTKVYDDLITSHPRIKTFFDGYEGYDINNTIGYEKILIIDDGSHIYDDVKKAFMKFNKLVSVNSYYIIEDGILDLMYNSPSNLSLKNSFNGGPNRAVVEILENNEEYFIDRRWCDFFGKNSTFNPDGFLKRIK
jgi:cephalosporin hydroxylase